MAAFPRRGEIWLVDFPDDPKSRPALIVSLDVRNEFSNSILAVPITTNLRRLPRMSRFLQGKAVWHMIQWRDARTSVTFTNRVSPTARLSAWLAPD